MNKNKNSHPAVLRQKAAKLEKAVKFCIEMKALNVPKKTVLISLMQNYGLKLTDARSIYRATKAGQS